MSTITTRCANCFHGKVEYRRAVDLGSSEPRFTPVENTYRFAQGHLCQRCANAVFLACEKRRAEAEAEEAQIVKEMRKEEGVR